MTESNHRPGRVVEFEQPGEQILVRLRLPGGERDSAIMRVLEVWPYTGLAAGPPPVVVLAADDHGRRWHLARLYAESDWYPVCGAPAAEGPCRRPPPGDEPEPGRRCGHHRHAELAEAAAAAAWRPTK